VGARATTGACVRFVIEFVRVGTDCNGKIGVSFWRFCAVSHPHIHFSCNRASLASGELSTIAILLS